MLYYLDVFYYRDIIPSLIIFLTFLILHIFTKFLILTFFAGQIWVWAKLIVFKLLTFSFFSLIFHFFLFFLIWWRFLTYAEIVDVFRI